MRPQPELGWGAGPQGTDGYLDVPVQQLLSKTLQRHGGVLWEVGLPVEEGNMRGVTGEGLGVKVLEGFEVIVDGMPHHYLPCEDLQDLQGVWRGSEKAGSMAAPLHPQGPLGPSRVFSPITHPSTLEMPSPTVPFLLKSTSSSPG